MMFVIFIIGFAASADASLYGIADAGKFIAFSALPTRSAELIVWRPSLVPMSA
jgi:hypothetical protein